MDEIKMELYNDNFQNFKQYNIPKALLAIGSQEKPKASAIQDKRVSLFDF